jgi:hypothetical protein
MVETVDIELPAHHAVIETSLLLRQETEFSTETAHRKNGRADAIH